MPKLFTCFLSIFFFCNNFISAYNLSKTPPILHVCTVATKRTKGLDQLLNSCTQFGVTIDILGMDTTFRGLAEKLMHVENYLQNIPDQDVVMFVDGYDVLILATPETILKKFLEMRVPYVISVERYCFPYKELASEFPNYCTSFKYINSGSYIGYTGYLKQILKELHPYNPWDDDQGLLTLHFVRSPQKHHFDSRCELFMPFAGLTRAELIINQKNLTVQNCETDTFPCVIHGNGSGRSLYQEIYEQLFSNNPHLLASKGRP